MINRELIKTLNVRRMLIAILWPSFVSAGIALVALYVLVDPSMIAHAVGLPLSSRVDVYSISFFFLWMQAVLASTFCLIFVAPTRHLNVKNSS